MSTLTAHRGDEHTISILLADDHKMMRDGLRAILEKAGHRVVGEAGNGREALALAQKLRPAVVLMDVSMPELNGIDGTKALLSELPAARVIGLSMHSDQRYVGAMFRAGAAGYLLKNAASEELEQAVQMVSSGLRYVSPSIAGHLIDELVIGGAWPAAAPNKPLSPREREVLQLLAEGKTSKEIAGQLNLAVATIETHRRQITDKLDLHSVAELTKYAIREGLTTLE